MTEACGEIGAGEQENFSDIGLSEISSCGKFAARAENGKEGEIEDVAANSFAALQKYKRNCHMRQQVTVSQQVAKKEMEQITIVPQAGEQSIEPEAGEQKAIEASAPSLPKQPEAASELAPPPSIPKTIKEPAPGAVPIQTQTPTRLRELPSLPPASLVLEQPSNQNNAMNQQLLNQLNHLSSQVNQWEKEEEGLRREGKMWFHISWILGLFTLVIGLIPGLIVGFYVKNRFDEAADQVQANINTAKDQIRLIERQLLGSPQSILKKAM